MAWAWCLGGGDPASAPFRASLWLLGVYSADRICTGLFRPRTGRSIHGYTPLDEKLRTFLSRRNVNLALFTVALLIDWLIPGPGTPPPWSPSTPSPGRFCVFYGTSSGSSSTGARL